MSDLWGRTTLVVGASRGLGRGIAGAFAQAGAAVVAVARTGPALAELATTSPTIRTEVADATDPTVAQRLLDQYRPEVLILVAGRHPGDAAAPGPDVGDVLGQLAGRRQDHLHLAAGGTAAAAAARQPGGGGQQRRRHQRLTGQRRIRRVQGHPAVHRRLRPGGVAPCRTGHHRHRGAAHDDAVRRGGPAGGSGVCGPRRPERAGLPGAAGGAVDPRGGRVRAGGPGPGRGGDRCPPGTCSPPPGCSGCHEHDAGPGAHRSRAPDRLPHATGAPLGCRPGAGWRARAGRAGGLVPGARGQPAGGIAPATTTHHDHWEDP
jgi:hypothetical protein